MSSNEEDICKICQDNDLVSNHTCKKCRETVCIECMINMTFHHYPTITEPTLPSPITWLNDGKTYQIGMVNDERINKIAFYFKCPFCRKKRRGQNF